jgi:sugar phosphate isomerase/epimerase
VNVAEYSPHVSDAATDYLKRYVDLFPKLGASWMVVHAGYHFTKDRALRMKAGRERLQRVVAHAEKKKALVLLENLNKEPADAEVHYLAHTLEEWQYYWDIRSPAFKLSFTANHAHLVPEGIEGFVAALDFRRVGEVRLADCYRNGHEIHLQPGAGNLDFGGMFGLIEGKGYQGHYTNAFGSLGDMLAGRDYLVERARAAGVAVD